MTLCVASLLLTSLSPLPLPSPVCLMAFASHLHLPSPTSHLLPPTSYLTPQSQSGRLSVTAYKSPRASRKTTTDQKTARNWTAQRPSGTTASRWAMGESSTTTSGGQRPVDVSMTRGWGTFICIWRTRCRSTRIWKIPILKSTMCTG